MRTQKDHVMIGCVVTSDATANNGHHTRLIAEAVSLAVLAKPRHVIWVR
jgi:predicted GNAT family N-acyltransferase